MKPAPFGYHAPRTLGEALDLLGQHVEQGDDVKLLAGGQSLVPTMSFRLAQPAVLIDLNRIESLDFIERDSAGGLRIGAMTRQRTVERSRVVAEAAPLVTETMPWIAHPQIRNRGTFGGSLAHADPAAELPAVAIAAGASLRLQRGGEDRTLPAEEFFTGLFETALAPDEILTGALFPAVSAGSGFAFSEVARRHGDYALVGVAVRVECDESGECSDAKIVLLSVGEGPVAAVSARDLLAGERPTAEGIEAAARAVKEEIDPPSDIHASADYRRHLAGVLTGRTLRTAFERAGSVPAPG